MDRDLFDRDRLEGDLLDRAVGPLTPGRVGAVLGFVGGVTCAMLAGWAAYGEMPNLYPMFAIPGGGGLGAIVGFAIGRLARRPARPKDR